MSRSSRQPIAFGALASTLLLTIAVAGQTPDPLLARVRQEQTPLLNTLRELVAIESGSRDLDGLNRISDLIASRLRALGGAPHLALR